MRFVVGKRAVTSNVTVGEGVYLNVYKNKPRLLEPLSSVTLTPAQARRLAKGLLKYARKAEKSA